MKREDKNKKSLDFLAVSEAYGAMFSSTPDLIIKTCSNEKVFRTVRDLEFSVCCVSP